MRDERRGWAGGQAKPIAPVEGTAYDRDSDMMIPDGQVPMPYAPKAPSGGPPGGAQVGGGQDVGAGDSSSLLPERLGSI